MDLSYPYLAWNYMGSSVVLFICQSYISQQKTRSKLARHWSFSWSRFQSSFERCALGMKDGNTALKTVPCGEDKDIGFFSWFGGSESTIVEENRTYSRNSGVVPSDVLVCGIWAEHATFLFLFLLQTSIHVRPNDSLPFFSALIYSSLRSLGFIKLKRGVLRNASFPSR